MRLSKFKRKPPHANGVAFARLDLAAEMSESGRVLTDAETSMQAPYTPAPRTGPAPSKYARDPKIWTPVGTLRDEIVRDIAQRLRAGEGYDAITSAVGISRKAGRRKCAEIAAALGLPPERSRYELDVEEVRRRADAGETNSEIAAAMGRATATVSQIRRKIGLGHGRQLRFTPQENAEVERRLMLGESTRAIAIAIGCEQADVSRRRQAIKHLIPTDLPPCECGKRRNHGGRCLAVIDPSFIRERLLAGHTAAAIARELGRSAQNLKPMYIQPVIDQLTAEGHVCPCGLPFGHQFVCAATNARRLVFSDMDRARAKHLVLQGVAIERVRADLGMTLFAARRLVEGLREELAAQGAKCPCGLAIDHSQTCTIRNGSARLAGQFRFRSAAAQTMPPPLRRKVSALARAGWPISAIVARAGETEWRVTQLVDELGAAGFLPTTCRGCDQPYRHKGPCPQPKLCRCGRPCKHRGLCRATDGRKRVPYTMLPPEQIAEVKKRFRARMSINAIARATCVPLSVVQRLVKRWRDHPGYTAKTCACGRPAFHPGGCIVNTPGAVGKRLVARIEAGVLAARPMRVIADDLGLTPIVVAQHSLPARERLFARGETCACGRIIGHPYWCSPSGMSLANHADDGP